MVAIELGVRLPSVDDPGLDLQLVGGEPLNPQAIEKPRSIGRHKRRLVRPVIEVVVTEQANVRYKNPGVDVEPMADVEVVTAVGFGGVAVSVAEVPLADSGAAVIARRGGGKESKHGQDPAANVLPVEIAAHADLLLLELAAAEGLGGSTHGVVYRLIEVHHIVGVEADFRSEELRIQHGVF